MALSARETRTQKDSHAAFAADSGDPASVGPGSIPRGISQGVKKPHPLLLVLAAPVLAVLAYVVWPESALSPLYCEGGVVDGRSDGGACFEFSDTKLDADPQSVGSAMWQGGGAGGPSGSRLGVRRTGSGKYTLVINGVVAGAMERDGRWIHVTFKDSGAKPFSLRSDRAGLMI